MDISVWVYYFLAVLVLTASPGPSVLLCVTTSVTQGFNASIYAALGSLTAIIGIMTLSFSGLGIVISSSEILFNAIKWSGAAYLVYLGYKSFISKEHSFIIDDANKNNKKVTSLLSHYSKGFIIGASNPKALIFFTALFPQFINQDSSLLNQYIIFSLTFGLLELSWLLVYAYLGKKSSNWLSKNKRMTIFNRVSGSIFISAGLFLLINTDSTNNSSV